MLDTDEEGPQDSERAPYDLIEDEAATRKPRSAGAASPKTLPNDAVRVGSAPCSRTDVEPREQQKPVVAVRWRPDERGVFEHPAEVQVAGKAL